MKGANIFIICSSREGSSRVMIIVHFSLFPTFNQVFVFFWISCNKRIFTFIRHFNKQQSVMLLVKRFLFAVKQVVMNSAPLQLKRFGHLWFTPCGTFFHV